MDLGQHIKARRKILKITQQDLAKAVQVSTQYISSIEQNQRIPSLPILMKISEELSVTLDYLVIGKEQVAADVVAAIQRDTNLAGEEKTFLIDLIRIWHHYKKQ